MRFRGWLFSGQEQHTSLYVAVFLCIILLVLFSFNSCSLITGDYQASDNVPSGPAGASEDLSYWNPVHLTVVNQGQITYEGYGSLLIDSTGFIHTNKGNGIRGVIFSDVQEIQPSVDEDNNMLVLTLISNNPGLSYKLAYNIDRERNKQVPASSYTKDKFNLLLTAIIVKGVKDSKKD